MMVVVLGCLNLLLLDMVPLQQVAYDMVFIGGWLL